MLEHSRLERNKDNSLEESRISAQSNNLSDNELLDQQSVSHMEQGERHKEQPLVNITEIESLISTILSDNKRMARFGKLKAVAALYEQAKSDSEKINSLAAIRDSAANYLIERKSSSDPDRKSLCERIISKIDAYAKANAVSVTHDTAYMLDGRYMTRDEIDNEIRLAHSLTGAEPLTEVTKERRDCFRKKLADVKLAKNCQADIEKWKNEKSELLKHKKEELGIGEGVNELYDSVCIDTILWYGRIYNRKDEAMSTMLSRMTIDEDKGSLAINIKARQIEVILADIMSWNMDDFTFEKSDAFLHRKNKGETEKEHFLRLYSKLQLTKNADILLGELLRMRDNDSYNSPFDFSENTLEELKDRIKIYKEIEKDYSERLSIMSSPYYALLQQSDTMSAMTDKSDDKLLSMKQDKDIQGSRQKKKVPPEFADYIDKLCAKKQRWDKTKINDYFTRHTHIESSIDLMLEHKGISVRDRKNRFITERNELDYKFTQDLTAFKQEHMEEFREDLKKAIENESPEIERQNIDSSMRAVWGRSFIPVERPASGLGLWGKLKSYGLAGAKWMIGATIGKIGTAVGFVLGASKQLKESKRVATAQKKRIHGIVPGTKDERFADEHLSGSDDDNEVLFDVRRAPLVWEKISAGDPDDPPEVSILSLQSIKGSRAVNPGDMGHAMIGLSYSRINKATGRKERYNLRIGFYPGGGATKFANNVMMGANALMNGQIKDDSKHDYNIARRYTVTVGAINRILLASEKYADGGYGYFRRNCTTFVTDMAKLADIPLEDAGASEVLDMKGVRSNMENLAVGGAYSTYYVAANNIADKFQKEDKSYQNFGQKLTTKEDLDRYYDTAQNREYLNKGASPGALGEDLREAKDDGELTSLNEKYNNATIDKEDEKNVLVSNLQEEMQNNGIILVDQIISRLRDQNLLTDEIQNSLEPIREYIYLGDILFQEGETIPDAAKQKHKKIRENMKLINGVYKNTLKNDALLNKAVMDYLGLCEVTLNMLDKTYQDNIMYAYKTEIGGVFEDYEIERRLEYKKDDKTIEPKMSPLMYYGYLKMGKSVAQIAKDLKELHDLLNAEELSDEQYRRIDVLKREKDTAMDFGRANYFNLSKDEFSEKDIENAFKNLPLQEMKTQEGEKLSGQLIIDHRPSFLQQAVILSKILGGISSIQFTDLDNKKVFTAEVDDYLHVKIQEKQDNIKAILHYYISGKEDQPAETLATFFIREPITAFVKSAIRKFVPDRADAAALTSGLISMTKTKGLIENLINELRNNGSV